MSLSSTVAPPSRLSRLVDATPILGPVLRAATRDVALIYHLLLIALTLLVLAVKVWGLVALTMAALAMVPVMFALFLWISWP